MEDLLPSTLASLSPFATTPAAAALGEATTLPSPAVVASVEDLLPSTLASLSPDATAPVAAALGEATTLPSPVTVASVEDLLPQTLASLSPDATAPVATALGEATPLRSPVTVASVEGLLHLHGAPLGSAVTSHYRHTRATPFRGAQWSSRARLHRLHPRLGQARPAIYLGGHRATWLDLLSTAISCPPDRSHLQHTQLFPLDPPSSTITDHGTLLLPRCPSHQLQLG